MLISFKHYLRSFSNKGFTLIELIVVGAIIIFITAFVLFRQDSFNSSTLLRSLAYSVALSMRQAQVYGTSVRETSSGSGVFASGYGVYVDAASPSQYVLFPDLPSGSTPGNGQYDSSTEGPPTPGTLYSIGKGYVISKICGQLTGGSTLVCSSGTSPTISTLTMYVRRPNSDACFASSQFPGACAVGAATQYSAAYVQIQSTGNLNTRAVKITVTGQISVCTPNLSTLTQC